MGTLENLRRLGRLGGALWVFAAPVAISGPAEAVRATRMAPDNAFSPEKAEPGRMTGANTQSLLGHSCSRTSTVIFICGWIAQRMA
jgi:hypothetical protein